MQELLSPCRLCLNMSGIRSRISPLTLTFHALATFAFAKKRAPASIRLTWISVGRGAHANWFHRREKNAFNTCTNTMPENSFCSACLMWVVGGGCFNGRSRSPDSVVRRLVHRAYRQRLRDVHCLAEDAARRDHDDLASDCCLLSHRSWLACRGPGLRPFRHQVPV
jgi:hypothetical protein